MKPWWNLNRSLAKWLGKQLIKWSHKANSHPPQYTYDEWTALLYLHGCTLMRYSRGPGEDEASNYLDLPSQDGRDWKLTLTCPDGFFVDEDDVMEHEAKASLQWVTDHFYTLWD